MESDTGNMGRGGARGCCAEFVFRGTLGPNFLRFLIARGRWLGLRGHTMMEGDDVIAVVSGQEALVDSFEVTCSLGPIDATVEEWVRTDTGPATLQTPSGGNALAF